MWQKSLTPSHFPLQMNDAMSRCWFKKKMSPLSGWDKTTEACLRQAGTTWRNGLIEWDSVSKKKQTQKAKGKDGRKERKVVQERTEKGKHKSGHTICQNFYPFPWVRAYPNSPQTQAALPSRPAPPRPGSPLWGSKAGLPVFEKLPAGTGRFCNRTPVYRHARPEGELCVRPGGNASVWPDSASGQRYFAGHLPLWVLVWERANSETKFCYVLVSAVGLTIYTCNLAGSDGRREKARVNFVILFPPIESEVREETLSDRGARNHLHFQKCSGHIGGAPTVEDEWEL